MTSFPSKTAKASSPTSSRAHEYGVSESERLFWRTYARWIMSTMEPRSQQVSLLRSSSIFFELVADIEVIFDGTAYHGRDDDDLVAACRQRFFHAVLNGSAYRRIGNISLG